MSWTLPMPLGVGQRKELIKMKQRFYLNDHFYLNYGLCCFQPFPWLPPSCIYTPDWRNTVSGVLAVDKYGQTLLKSFYFPSAIANETNLSHVDTAKALLTSRQTPATLLSSPPCEMFHFLLVCFPLSCVLLSLVSL